MVTTYIDLALAINKTSKVPQSISKGKLNINDFEDGTIIHQPLGVVVLGENIREKITKILVRVYDIERYTNSRYTISRIESTIARRNIRKTKMRFEKSLYGISRFEGRFCRL